VQIGAVLLLPGSADSHSSCSFEVRILPGIFFADMARLAPRFRQFGTFVGPLKNESVHPLADA